MMKDQSGKPKGYCFVRYVDRKSAFRASKERDGTMIGGRKVGVELSSDQDCLFFGNLPKEWSVEKFEDLVRKSFKDVSSVDLSMSSFSESSSARKGRLNRGFGFVRFTSHAAAARAHRMGSRTDFMLGDASPSIDWAEKEPVIDPDEMLKVKTAFVGNLPTDADEDYLQMLFQPFGKVVRVAISRKGHFPVGFVHFSNRDELDMAINEMDGKVVKGPQRGPSFKIQVSVARPAEKDMKRDREERNRPVSVFRDEHSPFRRHSEEFVERNVKVPRLVAPEAADPYEDMVISLPSAVKERLLRIFRFQMATRYDIDIHAIASLKELPESAAVAVLDQYLLSGEHRRDKAEYFASLIAKHRGDHFGPGRTRVQHAGGVYFPGEAEQHEIRALHHSGALDHLGTRHGKPITSSGAPLFTSRYFDESPMPRLSNPRYEDTPALFREPREPRLFSSSARNRISLEYDQHEAEAGFREPRQPATAGYRDAPQIDPLRPSAAERSTIKFNPFTGEPFKFDPFTGEPIRADPNSRDSRNLY